MGSNPLALLSNFCQVTVVSYAFTYKRIFGLFAKMSLKDDIEPWDSLQEKMLM